MQALKMYQGQKQKIILIQAFKYLLFQWHDF